MHIRSILMAALLLMLLPTPGRAAAGPFITMQGGGESIALTAAAIQAGEEAIIETPMGAEGPEAMLLLRRGSPNGTNLTAVLGDAGENLLGTLPQAMQGFDAHGELEEGFSLQVVVRDLNGDNTPEVLVASGDGAAILTVAVFSYSPGADGMFRCVGVIEGQNALQIDAGGVISVPYGSQGLSTEYTVAADGALVKRQ